MSKKASPTAIGAFVVGAIVLLTAAVMLFGGAELFAKKTQSVVYFPNSVKGLRVGSNVTFRGVRIGYVEGIQLIADMDSLETLVQVTIEVPEGPFRFTDQGKIIPRRNEPMISRQDVIESGLRAQLGFDSLVTGQLLVDLDFYPEEEAVFRGINPPHPEIPSIPSDIQQAVQNFQGFIAEFRDKVDVDKLLVDVQSIVAGANELVNSTDLRESLAGLNAIINDEDTQQLTASLQSATSDLRLALADTRRLVNNADAQIEPLVAELLPAIERLDDTLSAGETVLDAASTQIRGDTQLAYQLTSTLDEVQGAARSLRVFLDYIERNPEAFIRGKRP